MSTKNDRMISLFAIKQMLKYHKYIQIICGIKNEENSIVVFKGTILALRKVINT